MIDEHTYQPMTCPVCGKFEFTELQETDLLFRDHMQCSICGWIFDCNQISNPDLTGGLNTLSLTEYRDWYKQKIEENPNFNYQEEHYLETAHSCPVCHHHKFKDINSFDICPVCGWCDDELMEKEPTKWAGNSNDLCLQDFKERYKSLCQNHSNYRYKTHGF